MQYIYKLTTVVFVLFIQVKSKPDYPEITYVKLVEELDGFIKENFNVNISSQDSPSDTIVLPANTSKEHIPEILANNNIKVGSEVHIVAIKRKSSGYKRCKSREDRKECTHYIKAFIIIGSVTILCHTLKHDSI